MLISWKLNFHVASASHQIKHSYDWTLEIEQVLKLIPKVANGILFWNILIRKDRFLGFTSGVSIQGVRKNTVHIERSQIFGVRISRLDQTKQFGIYIGKFGSKESVVFGTPCIVGSGLYFSVVLLRVRYFSSNWRCCDHL